MSTAWSGGGPMEEAEEAAAGRADGRADGGPTVAMAVDRAIAALEALGARGEEIEEEWQYVVDLVTVYRGRLSHVRAERGGEPLTASVAGAIEAAIGESELIADPHRAIDWLSTLPQVVLFNLGAHP